MNFPFYLSVEFSLALVEIQVEKFSVQLKFQLPCPLFRLDVRRIKTLVFGVD